MPAPAFLSLEEILFIHQQEIQVAGGEPSIRDKKGVKACVDAPKASFGGKYLHDLFGIAASYITCITMRHPFVDGNKRTALASALTFLYLNGYSIDESHDTELAELVLNFVTKDFKRGYYRTLKIRICPAVNSAVNNANQQDTVLFF